MESFATIVGIIVSECDKGDREKQTKNNTISVGTLGSFRLLLVPFGPDRFCTVSCNVVINKLRCIGASLNTDVF